MENSAGLASLLSFTVGLLCVWFALFFLYRDYCLDAYRQKMFELRDQLFDEASDGLIDFNHPAYGLLRKTMNGYLRFGHKISLTEGLILFFLLRRDRKELENLSVENKLRKAVEGLSDQARDRIQFFHKQTHVLLVKHMCKSSPVFMAMLLLMICLIFPVVLFLLLKKKIKEISGKILEKPIQNFDSAAFAYGEMK